ncbi:MAG: hypothetical protein JHD16_05785 [Solirubrobacteraceae bacterium]|nr:hypothetical protein [Solirubrobacteraceae bacterium]
MQYYDNLWRSLERHAAPSSSRSSKRQKPRLTARWATITLVAGATVAVLLSMGSSNPALPVLDADTASAAEVSALPTDVRSKVKANAFYPFETHNGRAYVTADSNERALCLVIPDYIPDSYGTACAGRDDVARRGLVASMVVDAADTHTGLAALLLPAETTSASFISSSGEREKLEPIDDMGVVTFPIDADGTLEWATADGVRSQEFQRRAAQGGTITSCGDGKLFEIPAGVRPEEACAGKGGWNAP